MKQASDSEIGGTDLDLKRRTHGSVMDPGNDMDRETADVERVEGAVAAIKRGALAEAESL